MSGFFLLKFGGESHKVGEHLSTVIFDLEAYPEPKALSKIDLDELMKSHGSTVAVAKSIGASQAFVWERLNPYRSKPLLKSKNIKRRGK